MIGKDSLCVSVIEREGEREREIGRERIIKRKKY